MSHCILHFGMHKTGTSSIQRSLYFGLTDARFHYVDLGRHNASHGLVGAFSRTPEKFAGNRKRGRTSDELQVRAAEHRARLASELDTAGDRTVLISAEAIPTLKQPELDELVAFLGERCDGIRAVGYVRDPRSFIESLFQQQVKAGRTGLDPGALFPRYRSRLSRIERALGRSAVEYWKFDPECFPGGCVVRDFCARLGIEFAPDAVRRSNESLSLRALKLLYAYRRFGVPHGVGDEAKELNARLVRRLRALEGPRLRLHRDLTDALMETHREELHWMQQRVGDLGIDRKAYDGDDAVQCEADLLRFDDDSLRWLARELGRNEDALLPMGNDPARVAACIDDLQRPRSTHPERGILDRLRRGIRGLLSRS